MTESASNVDDLSDHIERRTDQFLQYLRLMADRSHLLARVRCCIIFASNSHDPDADDSVETAPSQKPPRRFIQFMFRPVGFCIDLPKQTLCPAEADQIERGTEGFFYLPEEDPITLEKLAVEECNPFRKIYRFGEEQSAAEDVSYIFFSVWKLPVDWQFFVTAHSWGDLPGWELNEPLA